MAVAGDTMVVDHPNRLHEGIDDGRPAEFEAAAGQLLRNFLRQRGLGRHLSDAAERVDLRLAVDEAPQQPREPWALLNYLQPGAGGEAGAFELPAVWYHTGGRHD